MLSVCHRAVSYRIKIQIDVEYEIKMKKKTRRGSIMYTEPEIMNSYKRERERERERERIKGLKIYVGQ